MTDPPGRLASLDALRGLAVASMIVVNNPGAWDAVWPPLQHAAWNGVTFADFVFPAFLFVVGAAASLSLEHRTHAAESVVYRRIAWRVVVLIALGLVLNATARVDALADLRLPGVLQRIAVVYGVTAVIVRRTGCRQRLLAIAILLGVHWGVLSLAAGGHPGGLGSPADNVSAAVDRWIFGRHQLRPLDPEGLLGTLSATATALLGSLAGSWMQRPTGWRERFGVLTAGAAALIALGLIWGLVLPLNKPLWTGSFAVLTAGAAGLAFAACYLVVDVFDRAAWVRPFIWLGANPLTIYFLSEVTGHVLDQPWVHASGEATTARAWLFWRLLHMAPGTMLGAAGTSLLFAVSLTGVWIAVAGMLTHADVRLRV